MRIIHVTEVPLGGVMAYLDEVADYQSDEFGASNVYFVIPKGSEPHLPSVDPAQIIAIDYDRRCTRNLLRFGFEAAKAIRRLKPDVVHLHSTFAGAILRPLLRTMPRRPKIVYCPHGWAFGMDVSDRKKKVFARSEKLLSRITDLVVVNSESERELGLRYGIEPRRIQTILNGISSDGSSVPPRHVVQDGPIQAAFIGRFDRQKGLDILLDAVEALPETALHLHLVGKGEVYGRGGAERLARSNITLHGWLPRTEVSALLARMEVVIMPSRWEAQPLVALEAMRSGVAVIASNRPGLPEVIRDGVDGFIFDLEDPPALPQVLASMDRQQLRLMGQSAKSRFEAEFTAQRMNVKLHRAYQKLLGQRDELRRDKRKPATAAASIDNGDS